MARVLGIETSCDETAAAVVVDGRYVESNVVASQDDVHRETGGVVPEVASRLHLRAIGPVVIRALEEAGRDWGDVDLVEPRFPLVCLIVSGGHSDLVLMREHGEYERLGRTLDDAAGEAFDKAARMMGL